MQAKLFSLWSASVHLPMSGLDRLDLSHPEAVKTRRAAAIIRRRHMCICIAFLPRNGACSRRERHADGSILRDDCRYLVNGRSVSGPSAPSLAMSAARPPRQLGGNFHFALQCNKCTLDRLGCDKYSARVLNRGHSSMNLASPERIIFGATPTSGGRLPIPLTCRRTAPYHSRE